MKALYALMLALVFATGLALSACNTIEGLGEDTEAAGEKLQDTSRDVRK